jgi:DNA replicative helicase MCM subunit Mcm2 (Cdc46/Mcm family)
VEFLREFQVEVTEAVDDTYDDGNVEESPSAPYKSRTRTRKVSKYMELIQDVMDRRAVQIEIDLDDVVLHKDASFAEDIGRNTMRYVQLFTKAVDRVIQEDFGGGLVARGGGGGGGAGASSASASPSSGGGASRGAGKDDLLVDNQDIADVLLQHRIQLLKSAREQDAVLADPSVPPETEEEKSAKIRRLFPPALLQRFEIRIKPRTEDEKRALALRNVKAADLGKLVTVRAIVLRASDVRPIIQVASYTW